MESSWLIVIKSIKSAYKSWAVFFGILMSAILIYKLYVHYMDIGVSRFIQPVIDFYNIYIGGFFNGFSNYFFRRFGITLTNIQSDFLLLYITFCVILSRPYIFIVIIKGYHDAIDILKENGKEEGIFYVIGIVFLFILLYSLMILLAPLIAISLFYTPHIIKYISSSGPDYEFSKTADVLHLNSFIHIGDYRLMLLAQFVGFSIALSSLVVLNILAKEFFG